MIIAELFFIILLCHSCASQTVENLKVVTRFSDLARFYHIETKNRNANPAESKFLGKVVDATRRDLCEKLFASTFMEMRKTEAVVPNVQVIREFTRYNSILKKRHYTIIADGEPPQTHLYVKRSRYRKITVSIGGKKVEEVAFPCLARDQRNGIIDQIYISQSYYLSKKVESNDPKKVVMSNAPQAKSLFLFVFDSVRNLVPMALIEESAHPLRLRDSVEPFSQLLHRTFDATHQGTQPGSYPIANVLIWFPKSKKLRLCATAMVSGKYENREKFWPNETNVDYRALSYKIDTYKKSYIKAPMEVTIRCKAQNIMSGKSDWYHVSVRIFSHQTVMIIFKKNEHGKLMVDEILSHVPVISLWDKEVL